jgi:putative Holliday junction resolvase
MSRLLGIDYGTVRIGLALSDPFHEFASPLDVLQHEVETIVVGKPLSMDGTHSAMTDEAMKFAAELEKATKLTVETWDERLSSVGAEREMIRADLSRKQRKSKIDKLAAQSILQGYLDSKHFQNDMLPPSY